jgi:trimeric autotransporter adhesin
MAVQQLTLNQTVKLIRDIALSHNQINTVYFGDVWEFLAQTDNTYPAMFYSLTGSQISGKNLAMDFSLFFLDRQLQDESNETDVLSDQLLIGQDIFSMMRYPKFDWKLDEDVSIEFFTENEKDYLAGVKLDITINYPMITDRCQVPSSFSYPDYIASIGVGGSTNYVKFLIDYPTYSALPTTGDPGKIYVTNDTNIIYRWVDTTWIALKTNSTVNWGSIGGTLSAQTDLQNALNAKASLASPTFTGTVNGITKSMVGLANVDNTSDASKPISSATQTALNAKYDASNPSGYISGITSSNVITALGYTPYNATNPSGYITGITSGNVTTALGFTPYNATNPSNFIDKTALSAGTGISYNSTTGVIASTITQYADSNARASISLTTTGTSGAATYNSTTGVLNIPQYTGGSGGSGTVTSVAMTVPTGLSVTGSPITISGTLAITLTTGYAIPTTASQTNWDTAYTNRITSLTTTGSSGSATLSANTLNVPTYTLAGLGGQASSTNLTSLSGLTYASASFVKMTASGTFSLDTNTYYLANNPSGYTNNTGTVTSVAALTLGTTGTDLSSSVANGSTTAVITLNVPTASASNRGALSSADWTTFNNKQGALTLTTTGTSGVATLVGNTLNIPNYSTGGGSGTVTSVSVVSANGFTGTVATATSTPAITLTTTITGLLKGNGTAISAATANTDYLAVSNPIYTGTLSTGTLTYTPSGLFLSAQQSVNSYIQAVFQNSSSGTSASSDVVLNNNVSTDTTFYGNLGMNSSNYTGTGSLNLPNVTYLTSTSADLVLGTTTSNAIRFVINSGTADAAIIKTTSQLQLPSYTATSSFTGTVAGMLAFDSSGNVITVAQNLGTVTSVGGTGTINGLTLTGTVTSTGSLTLGGTLDLSAPPAIGGTTASTGRFTTITSTVATGTAPFTVTSTTNVANLNASSLNGATFAAPGTIGGTTAGAGNFTSLSVTTGYYDIQPTPTALTATGTLTIAQIQGDLITVTSSAAVSLTLPTGTLTDAGVLSGTLQTNGCFDWFIINLGSTSGAVTMVAGTAHTYVGNATVAINTSAQFRTRKTAANTFVTYRIG